jgi:hypothetical protein
MRPARFEAFAVEHLAASPLVARTAPLRDAGDTRHPYGLAVRWGVGGEHRWQILGESAPGDNYANPEQTREGDPTPGVQPPELVGPITDADAETLLAHILTGPRSPELAAITRWSHQDGAAPGYYGLTIRCHTGARLYLRPLDVKP